MLDGGFLPYWQAVSKGLVIFSTATNSLGPLFGFLLMWADKHFLVAN